MTERTAVAQATTNTLLHAEALVLPRTGVINYKLIWLLKMLAIGRMTLDMGCGCDARARDCSVDDGNSSSPEQNKK